jgi:hypothetical protein
MHAAQFDLSRILELLSEGFGWKVISHMWATTPLAQLLAPDKAIKFVPLAMPCIQSSAQPLYF